MLTPAAEGIVAGDLLSIESDDVLDQLGRENDRIVHCSGPIRPQRCPLGSLSPTSLYPGSAVQLGHLGRYEPATDQPAVQLQAGQGEGSKDRNDDLEKVMSFAPRNLV